MKMKIDVAGFAAQLKAGKGLKRTPKLGSQI